jgi:hypothetical protein
MLVKHSSRPANGIVRQVEASSDEAAGGEVGFWSSVVGYLIESFALYAASIHPVGLFPVEPRQDLPQPTQLSRRPRRAALTLVSTTTIQAASLPEPEPQARQAPAAGYAIGFAVREREIEKAVAALAALDDRTLRDLGIAHRSHIERTVRYCHDC